MATFWSDTEINDFATGAKPADSDMDVLWGQQGNSRIGANVKFNDQIGGRFEYGTGVNTRILYGTYTFGNGSELLLGQTYTPSSSYFYSNSVYGADGDLLGVGQFYVGRVPMIQWKMGGLKVALVSPNNGGSPVSSRSSVWGTYSIDPVTGVATLTTDSDINKYTPNLLTFPYQEAPSATWTSPFPKSKWPTSSRPTCSSSMCLAATRPMILTLPRAKTTASIPMSSDWAAVRLSVRHT
jgi:hypothetical protein